MKKLQDIGHKENLILGMEEHLGFASGSGLVQARETTANTTIMFSMTVFISLKAKVYKCQRRAITNQYLRPM